MIVEVEVVESQERSVKIESWPVKELKLVAVVAVDDDLVLLVASCTPQCHLGRTKLCHSEHSICKLASHPNQPQQASLHHHRTRTFQRRRHNGSYIL